jgi:lysophospholipase L1-like esterase
MSSDPETVEFRPLTGLAIVAVVITLLLGALEVTTRIVYDTNGMHYGIEMWKYAKTLKRPSENWDIGHEHIPSAKAVLMGVPVESNSLGLRDREFSPSKEPGVYRILVLGDSMTFGWGTRAEDTYAKRLEGMLNETAAHSDRRRFEVINAGVGNYNTAQEVAYFKERGMRLDPDMVILGFYLNDAEPTPRAKAGFLSRHSYLYVVAASFLDAIQRRQEEGQGYEEYYLDLYRDGQPGWEGSKAALGQLIDLCRKSDIELRILMIPELHSPAQDYPFEPVHARIREIGGTTGVPVIEVRQAMTGIEARSLWVSPGDAHPNALAHQLIANELFAYLEADLLGGPHNSTPTSGSQQE